MSWPTLQDYVEALQSPEFSFEDHDLRSAEVFTDKLGIPKAISGNFATVFTLQNGKRQWAVRCFSRQLADREERYKAITKHLKQSELQCMVDFAYLPNGVKVNRRWYPTLKMEWINGITLDHYVKAHLNNPEKLQALTKKWVEVCEQLRNAKIAHGDLQHGNIIVTDGGEIKLIDYDGIIVQDIIGLPNNEIGHPHYQHPLRGLVGGINNENFLGVDNFSAHVIASSLTLLSIDPTLWSDTSGDDNLLFKDVDYKYVDASPLFQALQMHSDERIRNLTDQLVSQVIIPSSYLQVPSLNSNDTTGRVFPTLYDHYLNLPQPVYDMNKTSWLSDHITQDGDQLYAFPESLLIDTKRAIEVEFSRKRGLFGISLFKRSYDKFAENYLKQHFEQYEIVLQKRRAEKDFLQLSSQIGNEKRQLIKRHTELQTQRTEQNAKLQQSLKSKNNDISSAEAQKLIELRNVEKQVLEDFYSKSLRRFVIQPKTISGIGQKRIDALNSVGIFNASDTVNANRTKGIQALSQVHGSNGVDDWIKLVLWSEDLRRQIKVPNNLSNANEVSRVNSIYQKRVNDIKIQIDSLKAQHQIQENKLSEQIKQNQDRLSSLEKKLERLKIELSRYKNITIEELLTGITKFTERLIAREVQNAHLFKGKINSDWNPFIMPLGDILPSTPIPNFEMCLVPIGTFTMGNDDGEDRQKPAHLQTVTKPYWIARYPVTNAQWRIAVDASVVRPPNDNSALKWYNDSNMSECPIVGINWQQALAFVRWLGCMLPTEIETEYAARGVESWQFPWGNDWEDGVRVIYDKNSNGKPHPVTTKPAGASWVGAMHLSGNVWEWQRNLYRKYSSQPEAELENTGQNRVVRGGSFNDSPSHLQSANRYIRFPDNISSDIGFRFALLTES